MIKKFSMVSWNCTQCPKFHIAVGSDDRIRKELLDEGIVISQWWEIDPDLISDVEQLHKRGLA